MVTGTATGFVRDTSKVIIPSPSLTVVAPPANTTLSAAVSLSVIVIKPSAVPIDTSRPLACRLLTTALITSSISTRLSSVPSAASSETVKVCVVVSKAAKVCVSLLAT